MLLFTKTSLITDNYVGTDRLIANRPLQYLIKPLVAADFDENHFQKKCLKLLTLVVAMHYRVPFVHYMTEMILHFIQTIVQ